MSRLWRLINGLRGSVFLTVAFLALVPPDAYAADDDRSGDEAAVRTVLTLRHTSGITSLAWSSDGRRLATAGFLWRFVSVWNTENGELYRQFARDGGHGDSLAFSGDVLLMSGAGWLPGRGSAAVSLWNIESGKIEDQIDGQAPDRALTFNAARLFALSPDQKLLAFVGPTVLGPIVLVDAQNRHAVGTLSAPHAVTALSFSPTESVLAAGMNTGEIVLFDLHSGSSIRSIQGYPGRYISIQSLAFSPDGGRLASSTSDRRGIRDGSGQLQVGYVEDPIRIWKVSSGELEKSLRGTTGWVRGIAWSPDGKYLASASDDHLVRLWNLDDGTNTTVSSFKGVPFAVAFSPDGRKLAAAGDNIAIISEMNASR